VNSDFLGPWLGASSSNDTNGTDATWTWVNGAPFSYAPWGPNQPDGYPGDIPNQAITYYNFASIGSAWGDTAQDGVAGFDLPQSYVVEFDQNPNGTTSAVPLPDLPHCGHDSGRYPHHQIRQICRSARTLSGAAGLSRTDWEIEELLNLID
jgi:hypothetical protein